jgi:mRNA interferase MazF
MLHMTIFSFADVLLVSFPFTDLTTIKKRPAIVISSETYNQVKPDLILIAVTSQLSQELQFGEMLILEWSRAGLLKASLVKQLIATLEKSLIIKKLEELETQDKQSLKSCLQQILSY